MTTQEFQSALQNFKFYLKPAMFTTLVANADIFSDETKAEIIAKLQEADDQMKELYEYQQKRENILKKGFGKMTEIYDRIRLQYQQFKSNKQTTDVSTAEQLISNL
jgi:hypothetical protein